MPTPLMAAAIVPATCVPWVDVVGFQAASAVFTTPPRQDALLSFAICVARSGWVLEIPVSSTPTTTSGLPVVIAWASATSICVMSHCSPQSGSPVGLPGASTAAEETDSSTSPSSSGVPSPVVEATASTPAPDALVTNSGLAERATSTPICR
jgi:hypothetical protein